MRYLAAYLLHTLEGRTPSVSDLEKVLGSVGIECDRSRAEQVINLLKGKDVNELIAEGGKLLSSVPSGGGGSSATAAAAGSAAKEEKEEEKEETKKEESEEESDDDMGFGLFN